jgi:hypothetical protein
MFLYCSYKTVNPDITLMKKLIYFGMVICMMTAVSCTQEDDQVQPSAQSVPETLEKVTYNSHISPLERKTCSASNCHNGFSENALSAGRMMAAVHTGSLQSKMNPESKSACGPMSSETREILLAWIESGMPVE